MNHEELAELGNRHLWGHFSTVGGGIDTVRIMERGDGCYIWDDQGNRYLDGLAGLFTVQVGHGRVELAEAARAQAEKMAYFPIWTYSHPMAIELAARLASHAPGDLNRVFFTTGGGEAVESAWKLAMQYFQSVGQPQKRKVISRYLGYHGTTMGALSITGVPGLRNTFEPLVPGAFKVANANEYRCSMCALAGSCNLSCANDIEQMILREGPDTVAAVFVEPVQNSGGCFVPADGYMQRVREICTQYDVLMVSDEVICAFGRLGHMFGADRFGYVPDIITCAKGLTSGYSPLGAMIVSDRLVEPFINSTNRFLHGFTFGGHPVSCAVAMANLDIFENEGILQHVLDNEAEFRRQLETLSPEGRACAAPYRERVESAASSLAGTRHQVVHNDGHRGNLLRRTQDTTDVIGVIDFGDIAKTAVIADLAICGASFIDCHPNQCAALGSIAAGYHSAMPLDSNEVDLLADLVLTRIVLGLLLVEYQARHAPSHRLTEIAGELPSYQANLSRWGELDPSATTAALHHQLDTTERR